MKRKPASANKARPATAELSPALQRTLGGALARHQADDLPAAIAGYREVVAAAPRHVDALANLGLALTLSGHPREAAERLSQALAAAPGNLAVLRMAYGAYVGLGSWAEAFATLHASLALAPDAAETWCMLGFVLIETGDEDEARSALERAVLLEPLNAKAWYELHRAVFDDRAPGAAVDALTRSVASAPEHVWGRFMLGVTLDLAGDPRAASFHLEGLTAERSVLAGAVDSWRYVQKHRTDRTRIFASTRRTLRFALEQATLDGSSLDLGVRHGISTRWIAQAEAPRVVHAFDSFQGAPEAWHLRPQGVDSTHGDVPDLPPNVELHVGLFADTLPVFVASHTEPLRFANVDCDLYSSTRTALDELAARIVPGTILVFDEYLVNDRWREDELKAFQESVVARGWRYEYLAFSLATRQAVVRILG